MVALRLRVKTSSGWVYYSKSPTTPAVSFCGLVTIAPALKVPSVFNSKSVVTAPLLTKLEVCIQTGELPHEAWFGTVTYEPLLTDSQVGAAALAAYSRRYCCPVTSSPPFSIATRRRTTSFGTALPALFCNEIQFAPPLACLAPRKTSGAVATRGRAVKLSQAPFWNQKV